MSKVMTFEYTGAPQTFISSGGIYVLEVWGAQGGPSGGLGGYTKGTIRLAGGQTVQVNVGGAGQNRAGGWNGGGLAGSGTGYGTSYGGGGATDIRVGGTDLNSRVIVAGGGGGQAASGSNGAIGGAGGGLIGGNGGLWCCGDFGKGGTQVSGGAGGIKRVNATGAGGDGALGIGGNGHDAPSYQGGGGGGGGYYGGGGASDGCGGAAGGGGSSYIGGLTDTTITTGVNRGNGRAVLTCLVTKKYLALDTADGNYKTYSASAWSPLGTNLTEALFLENGMDAIPMTVLSQLTNPKICVYSDDGSIQNQIDYGISMIPFPRKVVQNYNFSLAGKELNKISIIGEETDVKVAISTDDGLTWKANNNGSWISVNIDNKSDFLSNGMNIRRVNALTKNQLRLIKTSIIRFAYLISSQDQAKAKKVASVTLTTIQA